jgi:hypothetical protein
MRDHPILHVEVWGPESGSHRWEPATDAQILAQPVVREVAAQLSAEYRDDLVTLAGGESDRTCENCEHWNQFVIGGACLYHVEAAKPGHTCCEWTEVTP